MVAQCSAVPCRVMLAFCVSSMFLSHLGYINTMYFINKALSIVWQTQKPFSKYQCTCRDGACFTAEPDSFLLFL